MAEQLPKRDATVEDLNGPGLALSQVPPSPDQVTTSAESVEPSTAAAPPFPPPLEKRVDRSLAYAPRVGDRMGDFEILRLLGEGSFARVFLARQVSLHRLVALKITAHDGSEARTLAQLEHEHIVRVFAESVDPDTRLRLLCMQYVPGTTLDRVIRQLRAFGKKGDCPLDLGGQSPFFPNALREHAPGSWTGRDFLKALDAQCTQEAPFDPAALRTRELLEDCDFVECVCWIGSRLAEALAHAHGQGVLHRDIKPANILLNPYGKPLLADFNVAQAPEAVRGLGSETFGGTLAYMAPEHLEAFAGQAVGENEVGERSDVYSLGVVLHELATGCLPFPPVPREHDMREMVRTMAVQRRTGIAVQLGSPGESDALSQVIARCLEAQSEQRYQTAAELVRALEGCRELRRVARELPPDGILVKCAERRPFLWLAILALLPHCLASVVNISYNGLRIVLTDEQREAFARVTLAYNAIVYPLCLFWLWRLVAPVLRAWRGVNRPVAARGAQLAVIRQQVLRLPRAAAVVSALGWLPGGLLFPLVLDWLAGPVEDAVYDHFLISFTIAGLIALTYSVFGVQFVVLRILYPRLCGDGQDLRQQARLELASVGSRLWGLQLLAVLIPLAAATLLVGTTSDQLPGANYRDFRWLVIGLIGLGTAGFLLAITVSGFLNRTLTAFTGGNQQVVTPLPRSLGL